MYTIINEEIEEVDAIEEFNYMGREWFIYNNDFGFDRVVDKGTGAALPKHVDSEITAKEFMIEHGKIKVNKVINNMIEWLKDKSFELPINELINYKR